MEAKPPTTFKNLIELSNYFQDENVCRKYLEKLLWDGKPVCPHCGSPVERDKNGRWVAGSRNEHCGNPQGRPPGARTKLSDLVHSEPSGW